MRLQHPYILKEKMGFEMVLMKAIAMPNSWRPSTCHVILVLLVFLPLVFTELTINESICGLGKYKQKKSLPLNLWNPFCIPIHVILLGLRMI